MPRWLLWIVAVLAAAAGLREVAERLRAPRRPPAPPPPVPTPEQASPAATQALAAAQAELDAELQTVEAAVQAPPDEAEEAAAKMLEESNRRELAHRARHGRGLTIVLLLASAQVLAPWAARAADGDPLAGCSDAEVTRQVWVRAGAPAPYAGMLYSVCATAAAAACTADRDALEAQVGAWKVRADAEHALAVQGAAAAAELEAQVSAARGARYLWAGGGLAVGVALVLSLVVVAR